MKMIDLDECTKWLESNSFRKICLQIPHNLMRKVPNVSLCLQKQLNKEIFIIDTIYENCCNDQFSMDYIKSDACIHFGHACLNCSNKSIFYLFSKQNIDINLFYEEFYKYFQDETKRIILFYDTIFAHFIETIYKELKVKYKGLELSTLHFNSNEKFTKCASEYNVKVLGRSYNLPLDLKPETFNAVFLGPSGKTLMSLSMCFPMKLWHYYDGLKFYAFDLLKSSWFKRRYFLVEKIKEAQIFGIIITSFNVEDYLKITEMITCILKKMKRKVYLLSIEKMNPSILSNFQEIDIFVAVACPEKSLFDTQNYYKPIVTPFEVDYAFNIARNFFRLYAIDYKQMFPDGLNYTKFKINLQTDVSLISGKVINYAENYNDSNDISAICKRSVEVSKYQFDFNFPQLSNWNGLQQLLGKRKVSLAISGRDGLPVNYKNENI